MPTRPRYVLAVIKHETNTFSPIPTPYEAFGHGHGPLYGTAGAESLRGSNTPFGAYLDLAIREQAEIITPVVAESWPSGPTSRATFEQLMEPLEKAVRNGCDAIFLDLHGAMTLSDSEDAEGEILRRLRHIDSKVPIAVTLDYHANLSPETVALSTVLAGYKTYPHIDMYEIGHQVGEILISTLKGKISPVMAYTWQPILSSVMRHAPEDGPSGTIIDYARQMEKNGTLLAASLFPGFVHADTRYTGMSVVTIADGKRDIDTARATATRTAQEMMAIATQRKAEYQYHPTRLEEDLLRAQQIGNDHPECPVLLIDHCDNCGSGGTQDMMTVVESILKSGMTGVAIAPIRDPSAVEQMIEAGLNQSVTLSLGGKTPIPSIGLSGKPLTVSGRIRAITDGEITFPGPMYKGVKTHLGHTAVLDTGRAQIVVTSRHHEPFDPIIFYHCGIDPKQQRFLMLKSRIHYRAGFTPISPYRIECHGSGVTSADLSIYRYQHLRRPIYPLDNLA